MEKPLAKRIRAGASCDICARFYTDPVLLACGYSLCRACAQQLSPAVCPDCGAAFDPGRLTCNRSLSDLVEIAQQLLQKLEAERSRKGAGQDRAQRAHFCKQEKSILCQACCASKEHRHHDQALAESAAHYKLLMRKCLDNLKKEESDVQSNRTILESETLCYFTRTTVAWEKAKDEFKRMQLFLESQERQLLAQVTEVYNEIKIKKNEQISALSKKQSSLQDLIYEVEEVSHLPANELLENIGRTLQAYEEREKVQPRGSLSPELQSKISGLVEINKFLLGAMKSFRENVASGLLQHKGNTTPDPNGCHPSVVTSEETQPVSNLDQVQHTNPGSSDHLSE
ncbi:E3 ubiquitin-protein ligase TRIM11-like isoform X1 [Sphaerodactylus townsendi]|uniref:E3 ubiquitin-protein ligase TRIM11-like isoform X1 n=1 Tax=Sphaerodactylus townsendi TaxID=933632 RepID=UPI0020264F98|nr:E3 ubiquitin-protein ligase TRIM11-like isoform X1 [Sphaerodactylus townsendi]